MQKNLFAKSNKENSVFLDERYLYPEYIPDSLTYREKEVDSLVYCFEPILKARKPMNVFVAGPTGVGKTVSLKFVLKQLEDYSDRAKSIYLNCFEFNSRSAILNAIANFVGAALPRRGLATDEIFSKMLESMKKCGFTPIVILDEVDQLLISESGSKLLYDLLRIVEYEKQRIGIAMISNDLSLTSKFDSRVKSSFAEQTVIFDSYSPQQLKAILKSRVDLAFVKDSVSSEVIGLASAHAAKMGGDARIAIESLLSAGRIAEKENSKEVTLEHMYKAFEFVDSASLLKGISHLSVDEKILLRIIAENKNVNSGKIYEIYSSKKGELKERRLRDVLVLLEKKNYISSEQKNLGNKGKTKEFCTTVPASVLIKELEKTSL